MKLKTKHLFTTAVLALAVTSAFAATNTDMNVTGKIQSASCDIIPPTNFEFQIDRYSGRPNEHFSSIPSKETTFEVNCEAETSIVLRIKDNKRDTKPNDSRTFKVNIGTVSTGSERYFGIGTAENDAPIGAYIIRFLAVQFDETENNNGRLGESSDGKSWRLLPSAAAHIQSTENGTYIHPLNWNGTVPAQQAKNFKFHLEGGLNITKLEELPLTQEIKFDGSITIEVIRI
jgi:hypothetical protein